VPSSPKAAGLSFYLSSCALATIQSVVLKKNHSYWTPSESTAFQVFDALLCTLSAVLTAILQILMNLLLGSVYDIYFEPRNVQESAFLGGNMFSGLPRSLVVLGTGTGT